MHTLIGFVSDAHGNSLAFDRAIDLLVLHGAERIYFLGDAIGYLPSTAALDSIFKLGKRIRCVRGNHEDMLLKGKVDPLRESVYQLEAIRPKLTSAHIDMIASWPDSLQLNIDGFKLLLVHGSPLDPTYGYIYPDSDLSGLATDVDWVIMGNTHRPFIREQNGVRYVNAGSCGMPRDDGRYGSVALVNISDQRARILRFDITRESVTTIEKCSSVHPSVKNVFTRRRDHIIGELCD